jgi:hypothetical protein
MQVSRSDKVRIAAAAAAPLAISLVAGRILGRSYLRLGALAAPFAGFVAHRLTRLDSDELKSFRRKLADDFNISHSLNLEELNSQAIRNIYRDVTAGRMRHHHWTKRQVKVWAYLVLKMPDRCRVDKEIVDGGFFPLLRLACCLAYDQHGTSQVDFTRGRPPVHPNFDRKAYESFAKSPEEVQLRIMVSVWLSPPERGPYIPDYPQRITNLLLDPKYFDAGIEVLNSFVQEDNPCRFGSSAVQFFGRFPPIVPASKQQLLVQNLLKQLPPREVNQLFDHVSHAVKWDWRAVLLSQPLCYDDRLELDPSDHGRLRDAWPQVSGDRTERQDAWCKIEALNDGKVISDHDLLKVALRSEKLRDELRPALEQRYFRLRRAKILGFEGKSNALDAALVMTLPPAWLRATTLPSATELADALDSKDPLNPEQLAIWDTPDLKYQRARLARSSPENFANIARMHLTKRSDEPPEWDPNFPRELVDFGFECEDASVIVGPLMNRIGVRNIHEPNALTFLFKVHQRLTRKEELLDTAMPGGKFGWYWVHRFNDALSAIEPPIVGRLVEYLLRETAGGDFPARLVNRALIRFHFKKHPFASRYMLARLSEDETTGAAVVKYIAQSMAGDRKKALWTTMS